MKINQDSLVLAYTEGCSARALARQTGKSVQAILAYLRRRKVVIRNDATYPTKDQLQEARALYLTGISVARVMQKTGLSERWARSAVLGVPRKPSETLSLRKGAALTNAQTQCVLGTLLGDSHIGPKYLVMLHSAKQKEYLEHKRDILAGPKIIRGVQRQGSYSVGTEYFRMSYCNKIGLDPIRDLVLHSGRKVVNDEWVSKIDLQGIAYWFMDDGTSSWTPSGSSYCSFCSQGFTLEENEILARRLRSFGFDARVAKAGNGHGHRINIPVSSSQNFLRSLEPVISQVPCMTYKLKIS